MSEIEKIRDMLLNTSKLNLRINLSSFWEEQKFLSVESQECPYDDNHRMNCQEEMKELLRGFSNKIRKGEFENGITELHQLIAETKKIIEKYKVESDQIPDRTKCVMHWYRILSSLESQKEILAEIISISTEKSIRKPIYLDGLPVETIKHLDAEKTYQKFILPLSNPVRIQLLIAIFNGYKRFSDFERKIKLEGGHLIYHLKPLMKAGFVVRDKNKNYLLTREGLEVLRVLGYLNIKNKEY